MAPFKSVKRLLAWLADAIGRRLTLRRVLLGAIVFVLLIGFGTPALLDWMIAQQLAALWARVPETETPPPLLVHGQLLDEPPATWDDVARELKRASALVREETGQTVFNPFKFSRPPVVGVPWDDLESVKRQVAPFEKAMSLARKWQRSPIVGDSEGMKKHRFDRPQRDFLELIELLIYIEAAEGRFDDALETVAFLIDVARSTVWTWRHEDPVRMLADERIRMGTLLVAPHVRNLKLLRSIQSATRNKEYNSEFFREMAVSAETSAVEIVDRRVAPKDPQPIRWLHAQADRANALQWNRRISAILDSSDANGWIDALRALPAQPQRDNFEELFELTWQRKWLWAREYDEVHQIRWKLNAYSSLGLRCLDVAVGIILFEHDRGRLPESMTELIPNYYPAEPIDGIHSEWISFSSTDTEIVVKGAIPGLHPDVPVVVSTKLEMKRRKSQSARGDD